MMRFTILGRGVTSSAESRKSQRSYPASWRNIFSRTLTTSTTPSVTTDSFRSISIRKTRLIQLQLKSTNAQDPNQVPSYRANLSQTYPGQWQTPEPIRSIPIRLPPYTKVAIQESTSAGHRISQVRISANPTCRNGGYTPNTGNANGGINNGWPDVNFQVNTKELLDAGKEAALDAARRAFESNQNR